jgi:hypothetical protein
MGLYFTYRKNLIQMRFYDFVQISHLHILTKKINILKLNFNLTKVKMYEGVNLSFKHL